MQSAWFEELIMPNRLSVVMAGINRSTAIKQSKLGTFAWLAILFYFILLSFDIFFSFFFIMSIVSRRSAFFYSFYCAVRNVFIAAILLLFHYLRVGVHDRWISRRVSFFCCFFVVVSVLILLSIPVWNWKFKLLS